MLTHRLQLLLDDERYQRVHTLARQAVGELLAELDDLRGRHA
jgi:hypothetical protein